MDSSSSSHVNADVDSISVEFSQHLDLNRNGESTSQLSPDLEAHHEEHEHEDDDDDFTFMLIGNDDAPIHEDKLLPLFDQKLLLDDGEYELEEIEDNRLPIMPPVDKIFIESPRGLPSSKSQQNENDDISTGEYCAWSGDSTTATAELSKKSNSTGFSKLWRLKEKVGRSYSDGRDAFVFLKSSDKSATNSSATSSSSSSAAGTFVKVTGGKARVVKQRKPTGYEAYLRSRGEYTEEERKRSYLPYRPEMLGLFTNVHGGLTKNVHPY